MTPFTSGSLAGAHDAAAICQGQLGQTTANPYHYAKQPELWEQWEDGYVAGYEMVKDSPCAVEK